MKKRPSNTRSPRALSGLAGSLLLCAVLLRADFQPPRWRYRRPLSAEAGTLAVVNMDRTIYAHSQPGLGDLRVIRGQNEVPYVTEKMSGTYGRREMPSSIINQGVTASGDLELTVDVGPGPGAAPNSTERHNRIRLATPNTNFRQRVGVSTSDDERLWTRVRDDGYIFDFSQGDRRVSVLDVSYPVSSRRYVRVTVYGWNDPMAVSECYVTMEESTPAVRDVMASLKADPRQEADTQSTLYTWDLGVPGVPHDQLSLDVDTPAFVRAAAVETSRDGKDWFGLGQGVLSRFRGQQSVTLDFSETYDRYLRLRIYNRDDQPLAVQTATLSVVRTRLKFKPEAGSSYWLYYGNEDAHAPSYDLRDLLAREAPSPEATISAGPEEPNPVYREKPPPSKPWSEQHPEILYITLALAVVGMGTVTFRFMKKVGAERN